jgi:hypothetical protein
MRTLVPFQDDDLQIGAESAMIDQLREAATLPTCRRPKMADGFMDWPAV